MKKAIGCILTILGTVGVVKGIIWLIEIERISSEAAKEGIYFGRFGVEDVMFFFSLPVLIIGILILIKK